jgi:hypothetical protein
MGAIPTKPEKLIEMADRRYQVLLLARQGKTYEQIGQALNVSRETARTDLDAALKDRVRPVADGVRKIHIMRSEWVWEQAADSVVRANAGGNEDRKLRALDRCSVALERLAKLDGVDAPQRSEVVLTNDTIKAEIAEIEARLASGELEVIE